MKQITKRRIAVEVKLKDLLPNSRSLPDSVGNIGITGISCHTDHIARGDAFLAFKGKKHNALDYLDVIAAKQPRAVLFDASDWGKGGNEVKQCVAGVPIVAIDSLATQIDSIINKLFPNITDDLVQIGVTGTNGKSSVAWWLNNLLTLSGCRAASIGTLGVFCGEQALPNYSDLTTPDAVTLANIMNHLSSEGIEYVVQEVSSHALEQQRVDWVRHHLAIFTNISRDHLDYHVDMPSYVAAKLKLFQKATLRFAVVNIGDKYAQHVLNALSPKLQKTMTYGVEKPNHSVLANLIAIDCVIQKNETLLMLLVDGEKRQLKLSKSVVPTQFNIENMLAVFASALCLGLSWAQIEKACPHFNAVPGRLQLIPNKKNIRVIIDFAHTPDALELMLLELKKVYQQPIIVVFGCGGDRDQGKRPQMMAAVNRHAKTIIITNDNPRTEDPQLIVQQILTGEHDSAEVIVELDRQRAIEKALVLAKAGEMVVIAGKGHEKYQLSNGNKIIFDDVVVATHWLEVNGGDSDD